MEAAAPSSSRRRGGRVTFTLRGLPITYDAEAQEFQIGEHRALGALREGRQRIRLYLDRTGLELFASDGLVYVPLPANLDPGKRGLAVESTGGPTRLHAVERARTTIGLGMSDARSASADHRLFLLNGRPMPRVC